MSKVYVGLGANLGRPVRQLRQALTQISAWPQLHGLRVSSFYRTPPWGLSGQPDFINAVAELDTDWAPDRLLAELQRIETEAGRVRLGERWGPRTLDLDILHVEGLCRSDPDLTLPHPRIAERAFVLLPLSELTPELELPGQGEVRTLLAAVDTSGCQRLEAAEPD